MKKQLSILVMLFCGACIVTPQNSWMSADFNKFRKSLHDDYKGFRDSLNNEYVKFLGETWLEYSLNKGLKPKDKKPKPVKPIEFTFSKPEVSTSKPANVNTQLPVVIQETVGTQSSPPLDSTQHDKILSFKDNSIIKLAPETGTPINYFGNMLYVDYPEAKNIRLASLHESDIAATWKEFAKSDFYSLLRITIGTIKEYNLNDWAAYLLTDKICYQIPGFKNQNIRTLFNHFLLVQMGYDARICKIGTNLVILLPIRDEVYAAPYLEFDKINYYIFTPHCTIDPKAYIYSCTLPKSARKGSAMSLDISKEMKFPERRIASIHGTGEVKFNGYVNENLINFYKEYPQCSYTIMANTAPSAALMSQLHRDLGDAIKGKTINVALKEILQWVQKGFAYMNDDDQFGFEKPMFVDESLFYPYCDCEDRSIMFAHIVKSILNLDVILLDYPDHIATAVKVEGISGDYVMHNNDKYIVCDPTFIGAVPGQSMPNYKKQKAKLITVK